MLSDPVADMLTRIRNGYLSRKKEVLVPYSKFKLAIAKVLVQNGFLKDVKTKVAVLPNKKSKSQKNNHPALICVLSYKKGQPVIKKIIKVSKPGLRIYKKSKNLPKVLRGKGIVVVSTPKGVMIDSEARKKNIGGEIICQVW